ncbi:MFS transporter [Paraburkholderia flava]|uniref:MFS transporter n=1 Tax=Paraburkholderia flava TaxID=2547393 RepID=UPI00105E95AB|nr:MFS transporter [Paraburkholderia flava]
MGPITTSPSQSVIANEPGRRAEAAYWLLWLAMLSTTTGSMLLLLGLASILYVERGSSLAAGVVFISQWLLPIFLVGWLGRLGRFRQPVRVLACLEFFQLVMLLPVASNLLVVAFVGLVARGVLEAIARSLRSTALKLYIPASRLEKAATLFNASQYLGVAAGGVLSYAGIKNLDVHVLIGVAAGCHVLSLAMYLACPRLLSTRSIESREARVGVWRNAVREIRINPTLRQSIVQLTLYTAILQGFHTVARAALPVALLDGGVKSGLLLQAGIGPVILIALALYGYLVKRDVPRTTLAQMTLIIAGSCVTILPLSRNMASGFITYWIFFFCFELAYTKLSNDVLLSVDRRVVADVSMVYNSIVTACLAVSVMIIGFVADRIGFKDVCFVVGGAAIISALCSVFILRRGESDVTTPD